MPFPLIIAGLALGGVASFFKDKLATKIKLPDLTLPKAKKTLSTKQDAQVSMSAAEAQAAHQQGVALSAAGLFAVGAFTLPAISWLGLPCLGYNIAYVVREVRQLLRRRGNLSVAILDVVSILLTLALGFFFLAAVLFAAIFTSYRLLAKGEREAQTDFSRIFGELSDTVWLLKEGVEMEVALSSLNAQDVIVVRAGDMIPVDGHILAGEGLIDQHLLTGEAQPVEKKVGDAVLTSTLVISGSLHIQVEKQGSETLTGQIAKTLEHAASFKHKVQTRGEYLVEQGAFYTLLASGASLPLLGLNKAVAISYSGFGYQMRMAAPLMVLNYLRIASRHGILVKDGRALDTLHVVDTIIFDKTGTLTEEIPQVEQIIACEGFSQQQVLQYAASAEQKQKHPIAQAIVTHARAQGIDLLDLQHSEYAIGHGLHAILTSASASSLHIKIGSQRFIQTQQLELPEKLAQLSQTAGEKGHSVVYIATQQDQLIGAIELSPTLRPQAKNAIARLHELGMKVYIISGDQEKPTAHLAQRLGIDHYFAETLPQDKAKHVEHLQAQGHKVCFIGDGINDSVALQKADVSISLHGAATIAQDTADIVLMTPDLSHIPYLLTLAKELDQRMSLSERLNMGSGIACVSGIFLLGMGTGAAISLFSAGLFINLSNSLLPLWLHPKHAINEKNPAMNSKNSIQATFDTVAELYDHPALDFFNAIAEQVVQQIPLAQTTRLLDVATGTGKVALGAASQAAEMNVKGVDLSSEMLNQARQKARHMQLHNVEFEQMDMRKLQLPDHYFDVATCSAALFFFDDDEMVHIMRHIAAKVKAGGRVIISAFDADVFEPMNSLFFQRYQAYGFALASQDLPKLVNDEQLQQLFAKTTCLSNLHIHRYTYETPLTCFEDWWHILWNTSYREMFMPMSEQQQISFKQEHQAEINALLKSQPVSVKVGFAIASAIVN